MNRQKGIGCLYGIGVGPGDPELITVKARRILSEVAVIFVPQKNEESRSFALSIIAGLVENPSARVIRLTFPMVRDKRRLTRSWQQAAETIWRHLERGEDCAMVNVGDPMLYGTFIHVLEALKEARPEVSVEVIPGVSSINAAAASAIVPLAIGDERIAIISGHDSDEAIRETLQSFNTIVFMKPNAVFDRLLGILEEMNLLEKCVYVSRATTSDEEIIRDIRKLKGAKLDYFSLLIVRRS